MKRHAPATARNSAAIADVLKDTLPTSGKVLEIASGSGEHAIYFGRRFPDLVWQPSDLDVEALDSIAAWTEESGLENISEPIQLDAANPTWPVESADAILCCNMIHISPWDCAVGLFAGASRILPKNGPLILYGPFFEKGVVPVQSNLSFSESLKARNPAWGIRDIADLDALAAEHKLKRTRRYAMPANNLTLVFTRM